MRERESFKYDFIYIYIIIVMGAQSSLNVALPVPCSLLSTLKKKLECVYFETVLTQKLLILQIFTKKVNT